MFKVGEKNKSVSADRDGSRDHIVKRRRSMSKRSNPEQTSVFCGIDVSAATLAVAVQQQDQPAEQREFANSTSGHKALIAWLGKRKTKEPVSLEATALYSPVLSLASIATASIIV